MDPVTHGITGALIGKGFFSKRNARVAIFAATFGAVFPDVDVFVDALSHDPLAIARYHRGFTHSFFGLPVFALVLAWLTRSFVRWYARRTGDRELESPSFAALFLIYAVAIASHILLDTCTSFGTRIWNPFSKDRVAWDVLFIIDFTFTAIILLPQVAAWIYSRAHGWADRAGKMWGFFTVLALAVWALARGANFGFSLRVVAVASIIFAALFFLPSRHGWGLHLGRAKWCRGGFYLACVYVFICAFAHYAAMNRVRAFAVSRRISVEKLGALPLPPSLLDWNGLISSPDGVYQSRFSLLDRGAPDFHFIADSPSNRFTAEAAKLETVGTYLWFARFPVTRYVQQGGDNIVEYFDPRFSNGNSNLPTPFTFAVTFDSQGKLLHLGWLTRGVAPASNASSASPPGASP